MCHILKQETYFLLYVCNIMNPEFQTRTLDFKRGSVAELDQVGGHHHVKEKVPYRNKTKRLV